MSADTRFHEAIDRWKQRTRRYELAVLLSVLLFGWVAFVVTVRTREAALSAERQRREAVEMLERQQDDREAEEAAPIMEEAKRRRLERLNKQLAERLERQHAREEAIRRQKNWEEERKRRQILQ